MKSLYSVLEVNSLNAFGKAIWSAEFPPFFFADIISLYTYCQSRFPALPPRTVGGSLKHP